MGLYSANRLKRRKQPQEDQQQQHHHQQQNGTLERIHQGMREAGILSILDHKEAVREKSQVKVKQVRQQAVLTLRFMMLLLGRVMLAR